VLVAPVQVRCPHPAVLTSQRWTREPVVINGMTVQRWVRVEGGPEEPTAMLPDAPA